VRLRKSKQGMEVEQNTEKSFLSAVLVLAIFMA
jgi:hypothetical protein